MDIYVWLAFFIAATGIAISPGNGALLSMSHGLAYGFRATHITIVGLQTGLICVMLAAGYGLGALFKSSPLAFMILKFSGGIYLIFLGTKQIYFSQRAQDLSLAQQQVKLPSRWQRFYEGFLTDISNAKGVVFMVAMLPQFIQPSRNLSLQIAILTATMVVIDTIVMHGYALLASRLAHILKNPRASARLNIIFGAVLIVVGVTVFFA